MPIAALGPWLLTRLRVLLLAVITAAILHIVATLAAPRFAGSTPFSKLAPVVPLHKLLVMPAITPTTQPLAFMAPDVRYAMCRYDTGKGPVTVSARLPGRGWALALYTPAGDNFYTASGQDGQSTDIVLQLTPVADRFLGLTAEARGLAADAVTSLDIATDQGLIVVRAPDRGVAYRNETDEILKRANCVAHPF